MAHYIPVGIDHGTTNSSIAVLEGSAPRVLVPPDNDAVMPSAVYLRNDGRQLVGRQAYQAMMVDSDAQGNGHNRYKPTIGQDIRYEFQAARAVMSGPDLGAMVIRQLLSAYTAAYPGITPKSCVITIPANFSPQNHEGTREAARRAGLLHFPFIQEPVAAAMAYGLNHADERTQWLVFDLGGGTLDLTLMATRNQESIVLGHAGHETLGGGVFDRDLFDFVVAELKDPRKQGYKLANFSETNPTYRVAWKRLMLAVEAAKIQLSTKNDVMVDVTGELCKDEAGRAVLVEVPITKARYEQIIGRHVEKAVQLCQMLLHEHHLRASQLSRIILVGGPTKTPYVQQVLRDRLKCELDARIDPMTAVAQGAAIHASAVEIPREVIAVSMAVQQSKEVATLRLEYERTSKVVKCPMTGLIEPGAPGQYVEIRRTDGAWTSGKIPTDGDGMFMTEVVLKESGKPFQSSFKTEAFAADGRRLASKDEPHIWYPPPGTMPTTANSLRIGLKGNRTETLVRRGETLPAKSQPEPFATAKALKKGTTEDMLSIPIYCGIRHAFNEESDAMDAAALAGVLQIKGDDSKVTMDLPVGSKVLVTVSQSEDMVITAIAVVELLDDEFLATFSPDKKPVDVESVEKRLADLSSGLEEIRTLQTEEALPAVSAGLEKLDPTDPIGSIRRDLERAKSGEVEAAQRAYKNSLELAGTLDYLHDRQRRVWIERKIAQLRQQVNADERADLEAVEKSFAAASDDEGLRQVEEATRNLEFRVRAQPYFEVLLDLIAVNGMRATQDVIDLFQRADKAVKRVDDNGGHKKATDRDLQELRELHAEIRKNCNDLDERRRKALQEISRGGGSVSDLAGRSDLVKL